MSIEIDYSWRSDGNCRGLEVNDFYPERGVSIPEHVKKACQECPVKQKCLNHALLYERHGYWGGTTEEKRRTLRRGMGITSVTPEILYNRDQPQPSKSRKK